MTDPLAKMRALALELPETGEKLSHAPRRLLEAGGR